MKKTGLAHFVAAAGYSWRGFCAAWRGESAFRQEVMLLVIGVPLAWWLGHTLLERALLVSSLLLILLVELMNSAIESVVDRIGFEVHELSGKAKDMGSAAVFLSLVIAGTLWISVLWERFYA